MTSKSTLRNALALKAPILFERTTFGQPCRIRRKPNSKSGPPSVGIQIQFSSVTQSCPTLCDPMNCSTQASLSITNSRSPPKPMSIELVMPSNHLTYSHTIINKFTTTIKPGTNKLRSQLLGIEHVQEAWFI